jgi:hypothetical protein
MELFDLKEDIGEQHDLVASNPEKVRELSIVLSDYLKEVNAQMPIHKNTGLKVSLPINAL